MSIEAVSMKSAAISMVIAWVNAATESDLDKTDLDIRKAVNDQLDTLLGGALVDATSWSFMKKRMLYDLYLEYRKSEGKLTELDLIRPGLTIGAFSDTDAFVEHCTRVGESRRVGQVIGPDEVKICSECGQEKPRSKFRKKGGGVCNACQCAKYRKRKEPKDVSDVTPE